MIMKRKLPSQTEKLDEDLLEEEENSEGQQPKEQKNNTETTSPKSEASGGGSGVDPSGDEQKKQNERGATRQPDTPASPNTPTDNTRPQDAPHKDFTETSVPAGEAVGEEKGQGFDQTGGDDDILDPFVHSDDDGDMTRTSPPQRPQNSSAQESSSVPPRKHQVSAEALLGGGNTQEKTQQGPPQQEFEPTDLSEPSPETSASDTEKTTPAASAPDEKTERLDPDVGADNDFKHDGEHDGDTWDIGDLVDVPEDASNVGVTPFAGKSDAPDADPNQEDVAPPPDAPPPWRRKEAPDAKKSDKKKKSFTPKLPKTAQVSASKTGAITSLFLVALLIGGTALLYQNRDVAVEVISRWTGTLNEVGQPVPEEVTPQASKDTQNRQPPDRISQNEESAATFQARNETGNSPPQENSGQNAQNDENINLEVLDVPADEADEPIVGDDNVDMPEDIDKFSSLQKAIAEKRAERQKEASAKLPGEEEAADPSSLSPEEMTRRNAKIIRKTNKTLAEYRQALADVDDPALKPRPGQFMEGRRKGNNSPLPPPQQRSSGQQKKPQLYGNKVVSNLSELIEQKQQKENDVRTLDDFEVALFNPRRKEVSIPKGITPRLTKESFPPLEVLSFVPNQGIIAKAKEQEGVLLLGETLEGWELIEVKSDYAEFQKNGQKRIVTFNHANR